jgi:hypothetical protein
VFPLPGRKQLRVKWTVPYPRPPTGGKYICQVRENVIVQKGTFGKLQHFKAQWSLYVSSVLTHQNSVFCPHGVFVCFVAFDTFYAAQSVYIDLSILRRMRNGFGRVH